MIRFLPISFLLALLASPYAIAQSVALTNLGKGHHAMTLNTQSPAVTLIASETSGLAVTTDGQRRTLKAGRFSQLDSRKTDNGDYVIALLDTNTQAAQLLLSDLTATTPLISIPAGSADIEALCLGRLDDTLMLFRADAAGQLSQTALITSNGTLNAVPLRTINIGPGVKACSVDDKSQTLYLADEYAGVWAMPAHQEAEVERKLLAHTPDNAIEGVSVSENGLLAWVSPDQSVLSVRDTHASANNDLSYTLPEDVAAESLHLGVSGGALVATFYDDNSGDIYQLKLPISSAGATDGDAEQISSLTAYAETTPVARFGDAADDPAIWINNNNPEQSLILGTDKKAGLWVYDLNGEKRQFLPVGRVNNVDVRYDWQRPDGVTIDVAAASNRSDNSISLFSISQATGDVEEIARVATTLDDVYGLCMFQHDQRIEIFVNDTDGRYQQYALENQNGALTAQLRHSFRLPSQPEGCVADDVAQKLYLGEEASGIWVANLADGKPQPTQIIHATAPVEPDIEGLALYTINNQQYLIASSQGNNRYAVYETAPPYTLLGVFGVTADWAQGIDGVSETDGLETTSVNLGPRLPDGLMVVQDGRNVMPSENQNFKLIEGTRLKALIQTFTNK